MDSPSTNWLPISFMAAFTAVRITGSPSRFTALCKTPDMPDDWSSLSTLPVNINAQVDALTSDDEDLPRCSPQLDGAILSSMSSSMVSASGTRNNASARHIMATPSSVDRPYSVRNTSIRPGSSSARIASISVTASD